jgi:heptosyltransferase-2
LDLERRKAVKRILIVRTDRLGDVVLTLPLLPALRRCFPDAFIAMLLKEYTGEIVEGNPFVDEIIWYDKGGMSVPFRKMCKLLRGRSFDAAVIVYPRFRLACLMMCAGIPLRIGTGYRYYSFLLNRRVYEHRKDAAKHELEYNFGLLRELGCTTRERPEFFIDIPETARLRVAEILRQASGKKVVVIHPGSGGSAREWPAEFFGSLALTLASRGDIAIFVTGSGSDAAKVHQVVALSAHQAVSLCGILNVKELAALLRKASLFISNSTGPIHIAAAMGTPVIGLYPQHTAMSARRWGPWADRKRVLVPQKSPQCSDCTKSAGQRCECMASIPVEDVLRNALDLLEHHQGVSMKRTAPGERPA